MTTSRTTTEPVAIDVDTGSVVLHGDRWTGDGRGHVVLLHGGGQTRHAWRWSAERLAGGGWTVTTLDLRGHGDSDWSSDGAYRLADHARDLEHLIEDLGERPVVVGASLGGLTALTLQVRRPLARAIVLVDIVPRPAQAGTSRISAFMSGHLDGFHTLEDVAHAIAAYKAQPVRMSPDSLHRVVRLRDDGRWHWHWDPRIMRLGHTEDLLGPSARITVPVLVVRGAQSDVVSAEHVDEFLRHVASARSTDVSGVGHMVAGDNNHAFFAAMEGFLESLS